MSFTVNLYNMDGRPTNLNKSGNLTELKSGEITGELKNECSIIDPIILLKINDVSTICNCNYMYIKDFGRYYFVNNIVSIRNHIVEIHAHVDVLYTYASEIKKNSVILARYNNTTYGNTYLQDSRMASYQDGFTTSYNFSKKFDRSTENFILVVAGH